MWMNLIMMKDYIQKSDISWPDREITEPVSILKARPISPPLHPWSTPPLSQHLITAAVSPALPLSHRHSGNDSFSRFSDQDCNNRIIVAVLWLVVAVFPMLLGEGLLSQHLTLPNDAMWCHIGKLRGDWPLVQLYMSTLCILEKLHLLGNVVLSKIRFMPVVV